MYSNVNITQYLIPLNCTPKNNQNGNIYIMFILPQNLKQNVYSSAFVPVLISQLPKQVPPLFPTGRFIPEVLCPVPQNTLQGKHSLCSFRSGGATFIWNPCCTPLCLYKPHPSFKGKGSIPSPLMKPVLTNLDGYPLLPFLISSRQLRV